MNDFTKDELQDIEYALTTVYMGNSELVKKIQSMIDDLHFCKNNGELTQFTPACPKCGSRMNDTAAVFWNAEHKQIIEYRVSCFNKRCDYVWVSKHE